MLQLSSRALCQPFALHVVLIAVGLQTGREIEAKLKPLKLTLGHEPDSVYATRSLVDPPPPVLFVSIAWCGLVCSEFSTMGGWVATRASGMVRSHCTFCGLLIRGRSGDEPP